MELVDLQAQRQRLGGAVEEAIARVLDHGRFVMGPEVAEVEARLAEYCGARYAVSCASGTDALLLVLLAWDVGRGDAIFVPAFTFAATAEVVALVGATPVFVDVLPTTFNLDPDSLHRALAVANDASLRPAAVIPVDLFGQPADYPAIEKLAADAGMLVLADAAQSFGASRGGVRTGCFGAATATSFFPAKPLGCYGDGGAVLTDDADLAAILRSLRVHGQGVDKYDNVRVGINGRLDTIQAAILLQKLTVFEEELAARQEVAARYARLLRHPVEVPVVEDGVVAAWAHYTVQIPDRDRVNAALDREAIPTAVYYPRALNRQPAFSDMPADPEGTPVARMLSKRVLSLPMHPYLQDSDQERVAEALVTALPS